MNYQDECRAAEEEGYEAGLSGRPKSEFADKFEGDLGFYFLQGYCLGVVQWGLCEHEEMTKKRKREMSKLTGKTYVRLTLRDANFLKEKLLELKYSSQASVHELAALANFLKACEEAEKREIKKQELADDLGEGTWGLQ